MLKVTESYLISAIQGLLSISMRITTLCPQVPHEPSLHLDDFVCIRSGMQVLSCNNNFYVYYEMIDILGAITS